MEGLIKHAIDAVSGFAMAHPVVFGIIVVTGIVAVTVYKISQLHYESKENRNDEDRGVATGNKIGRIGQS